MPTSENATLTALRKVADPVERAAACQQFITNGRATIRAVQELRDVSIRDARKTAHPDASTIDGFAARIRAKRNVIVDALRRSGR
ncbi:hypothetical protein [Verrucosispora sp. NA02020]|uniref:hypothetical protein n=1 Tax=Verrucosispora sp. NA02020 TaxID=2742132 RepID=UPI001590503F|nr:hypothetical protein [Verrucosispora sp. NA02020]QKW15357.1 hypothetical protein HUT12_23065 [Verrucosispora sp. NA02020]